MKEKDIRMKKVDEYISGIKTIKLNQWQSYFYSKIEEVRTKELYHTNIACLFISIIITSAYCTVPFV